MMTAFAIPGGAPVGAALAVGMGFFDIFYPEAVTPAQLQAATVGNIDKAVEDLKNAMSQEFFNDDIGKATRTILTRNQGLVEKIREMKTQGVDKKIWLFPSDKTSQDWLSGTTTYFTTPAGVLSELRDARDIVTVSSQNDDALTYTQKLEHRTKTTALYCLATSAILLYLKTALSWQWGLETLYTMAYPNWLKADWLWEQKSVAYQKNNPQEDPDRVFPKDVQNLSGGLLDWQDWIAQRPTAKDLITDEIDGMVQYALSDGSGDDGLFTMMNNNWINRAKRFDSSVANARLLSANSNSLQIISSLSNASPVLNQTSTRGTACPACIDIQNEVIRGVEGLDQWEIDTAQYGLDGVGAGDLALFHDTIAIWQDALETLQFQTLTAQFGDTPGSLAQRYYGDDTLWNKLLDPNESAFAAKTQDLTGVRVKIPYREGQKIPLKGLDMKRADLPALPSRLV